MNKAELIERIAEEADMPKDEAHKHLGRPSSSW